MSWRVVLNSVFVHDMLRYDHFTVHYIPLVVYYVVQGGLTLEPVDEMLKCNYESN